MSVGRKTAAETAAPDRVGERVPGCTCKPTFTIRGAAGSSHERVGKNLRDGLRKLAKVNEEIEEGAYVAPKNVTFREWAEGWRTGLRGPKQSTISGYKSSVDYAVEAFGEKRVRAVTVEDIDELVQLMAERKCSASTQLKHLRVLHQCFAAAIRRRLAVVNPLEQFDNRPKAVRRESAYFEDAELPKLMAQLPDEGLEGVFRMMTLVAIKTGMRHGELAALEWGDLDLTAGHIRVRRSVGKGVVSETKNRQARTVDLLDEIAKPLAQWWARQGKPGDDALVFPDEKGRPLADTRALYRLRKAMKAAGVPKAGPTGEDRDFHSLRHTFARISLEHGVELFALSRQLGHSSIAVTDKHYGHFAREAAKREARKLEGAFTV